MHITFIQAGGTIDKDYPRGIDNHGYAFWVREPAVKSILPFSNVTFTYNILEVVKKDSLDMTDEDRGKILAAVTTASTDKIIITHGTDTMSKTAEILAKQAPEKTVIFTGSMFPEKFMNSDARFNVGMAVAAVQLKEHGVYVALYGRVVPWEEFAPIASQFENKDLA